MTERQVALKLIPRWGTENEEIRRRLMREARACGKLAHRNVIEIYDVGETAEGEPFLVMQLLMGETLGERMKREGRIPQDQVVQITVDVARALSAAHAAGIIHRDLKPPNIFLHEEAGADAPVVKVLDFGVSKILTGADGQRTETGSAVGSPAYMSPEQAKGERYVDHRTDIWALGVVMFELLAGQRPFQGETMYTVVAEILGGRIPHVNELAPSVDPGLADVIGRCLQRDVSRRIGSADELIKLLRPYLPGRASVLDPFERSGFQPPPPAPPPPQQAYRAAQLSFGQSSLLPSPRAQAQPAPAPQAAHAQPTHAPFEPQQQLGASYYGQASYGLPPPQAPPQAAPQARALPAPAPPPQAQALPPAALPPPIPPPIAPPLHTASSVIEAPRYAQPTYAPDPQRYSAPPQPTPPPQQAYAQQAASASPPTPQAPPIGHGSYAGGARPEMPAPAAASDAWSASSNASQLPVGIHTPPPGLVQKPAGAAEMNIPAVSSTTTALVTSPGTSISSTFPPPMGTLESAPPSSFGRSRMIGLLVLGALGLFAAIGLVIGLRGAPALTLEAAPIHGSAIVASARSAASAAPTLAAPSASVETDAPATPATSTSPRDKPKRVIGPTPGGTGKPKKPGGLPSDPG